MSNDDRLTAMEILAVIDQFNNAYAALKSGQGIHHQAARQMEKAEDRLRPLAERLARSVLATQPAPAAEVER